MQEDDARLRYCPSITEVEKGLETTAQCTHLTIQQGYQDTGKPPVPRPPLHKELSKWEAGFIALTVPSTDTHSARAEQVLVSLFRALRPIILTLVSPVQGCSWHQGNSVCFGVILS